MVPGVGGVIVRRRVPGDAPPSTVRPSAASHARATCSLPSGRSSALAAGLLSPSPAVPRLCGGARECVQLEAASRNGSSHACGQHVQSVM